MRQNPIWTWLAVRVATAAVLGVVAAVAWVFFADPAQWTVTETGLAMSAEQSASEFSVTVAFVLVSLVVASMWGASFGAASRGSRPSSLFVVLGLSLLAGLLAWRLGILLGPDDPTQASGLSAGDLVDDELSLSSWVPFLAWPFGAALGMFSSNLFVPDSAREGGHRRRREPDEVIG